MTKSTCSFPGCDVQRHYGSTLCAGHRNQKQRGQIMRPILRGLTTEDRFWMKVEKTPDHWLWHGGTKVEGYGVFFVAGKLMPAHRYSYALANGPVSEDLVIDHICGTPACVRPEHLRAVTTKQNMEHRIGLNSNNKTGVRGVHWSERYQKYVAQIKHNYVTVYTAKFDSLADADAAVTEARSRIFTHSD